VFDLALDLTRTLLSNYPEIPDSWPLSSSPSLRSLGDAISFFSVQPGIRMGNCAEAYNLVDKLVAIIQNALTSQLAWRLYKILIQAQRKIHVYPLDHS